MPERADFFEIVHRSQETRERESMRDVARSVALSYLRNKIAGKMSMTIEAVQSELKKRVYCHRKQNDWLNSCFPFRNGVSFRLAAQKRVFTNPIWCASPGLDDFFRFVSALSRGSTDNMSQN